MYGSQGDNITLCWQIRPEVNTSQLTRFSVIALKRPVQLEMEKVASARKDGRFFRTYDSNHDGLYKDRVTMDADLQANMLFLRMTNYSNNMENMYCVLYEMFIVNDILTCYSHAVFLRTVDTDLPSSSYNGVQSTMATETNTTEIPKSTQGQDDYLNASMFRTGFIVISTLLGLFVVAVMLVRYRVVRHNNGRNNGQQELREIKS
ncbi:hypothetical protein OS493_001545 [Desmophyllum pertusum]|uniref:Uncharacterized protein n=1 Tax=Desmophyllum pertusum TaxID=174260 RepID=A0A9W9ZH57_9CNID|nr:hypothetical protein OS493_001545 [Desmophyllum pertusum]